MSNVFLYKFCLQCLKISFSQLNWVKSCLKYMSTFYFTKDKYSNHVGTHTIFFSANGLFWQ